MSDENTFETAKIDPGTGRAIAEADAPAPAPRLDRYELRSQLSKGGFATVYEAYDPHIKRSVAIKRCSSLDQEDHERFFREAEIAGNLSHPNIVRIFDFGVAEGIPFIVQELLGGKDLADWIESGLELSTRGRVRILTQIARGLEYAHSRDVIHRDIKPANVRVLEDGSIKLLDFGVAAIQEVSSDITQAGTTVGTAAYLAPEQIGGERPGRATDLFSFGVLAYELLSGHRPFEGATLSAVLYQIAHSEPERLGAGTLPARLVLLVHRCLDKTASQRPSGFQEVVSELEEIQRDPRLAPTAAETAPVATLPKDTPPTARPRSRFASGSSRPAGRTPRASLARTRPDRGAPPLRDSSSRIQVARPPRRAVWLLWAAALVLGTLSIYSVLGGPLPEAFSGLFGVTESAVRGPLRAWLGFSGTPDSGPQGAGSEPPRPAQESSEAVAPDLRSVSDSTTPPSAPDWAESRAGDQDPVTAAIASLQSRRAEGRSVRDSAGRSRRPPSSKAPATIFVPPSWHPEMTVSVDGRTFQPLDRRVTRQLKPGAHTLIFRLEARSYKTQAQVEIELEPAETRTVESPLAPPASLRFELLPASIGARVEVDGASWDLPLKTPKVLEPGEHRIKLHPTPADPLGPLAKTVNLRPAAAHLLTFDMRRRRAQLEVLDAFEWYGD